MERVKRLLRRKTTSSVVEVTPAFLRNPLQTSKRRQEAPATCPDLPAELWTTIWLMLSMRDRVHVSHVSQAWRDRAIAAAPLWTEFEYNEMGNQGKQIVESTRQQRLVALKTFLERSASCPVALGLYLDPLRGSRGETTEWTQLMNTVDAHRNHIARLSLRCATSAIVELLLRGPAFPMLAEAGGRLEWFRDGRHMSCTPLELAKISGGPGPRCVRYLSKVTWPSNWTYDATADWATLPAVEDLGPLMLNSPDQLRAVFRIFSHVKVLDITVKIEETDRPAPADVLALFARLRVLRLSIVPRLTYTSPWAYDALTKILPTTTSDMEVLRIDLPSPANDLQVASPAVFTSFRDFDHALGQILSLDVSIFSQKRLHDSGRFHVWCLSGEDSCRQRSVALSEIMSPKAASMFWAAFSVSAAPTIRDVRVPVSILAPLLWASDACLSSIESLEVEFVTGIVTDPLKDVRKKHQYLTLPMHLEPELDPTRLPALPQLKRLVLRSRFTDSDRVTLAPDSVVEIVQAFCPERTLPSLDVSNISTDDWSSRQIAYVKVVAEMLIRTEIGTEVSKR